MNSSALVFLQAPKAEWWSSSGSRSGSGSGAVSRGKADEPLLQRPFSFSLQPGCVSSGQDLGNPFTLLHHLSASSSSFLCCSINQLELRIWWLWGWSFLSYHCLGAVESLSPLQKPQRNTRGKRDNSLKPEFHDLKSSSSNMICSPSADVIPSTQSQPSRGKVSHLDSVPHWPFHFFFPDQCKKEFYIYFPSLKQEKNNTFSGRAGCIFWTRTNLSISTSAVKWWLMLWQWDPWCDTPPGTMAHGQGGEICCYGHIQLSLGLSYFS